MAHPTFDLHMPLPEAVRRALTPCTTVGKQLELIEAVQADDGWREATLAACNSSLMEIAGKFKSLEHVLCAVPRTQLIGIARVAAFAPLFSIPSTIEIYDRHCLWRHSVGTAHVAETIARVTASCDPDEAFLAGLCHDLGWLELEFSEKDRLRRWLASISGGKQPPDSEETIVGRVHSDCGGDLLEQWGASAGVVAAAQLHHQPHLANESHYGLVSAVSVANYLVSRQGWTSIGINNTLAPAGAVLRHLDINSLTLRVIWSQVPKLLDEAAELANSTLAVAQTAN